MSGEPQITVIGNAINFELRYAPSGTPVGSFTLPSTPRTLDKQTNEWRDGETLWLRCSCFGTTAENLAATMEGHKSVQVIAQGRLKARSYETKAGEKRTDLELEIEEIGPALRFATANVTRAGRSDQPRQRQQAPAADPWGSSSAAAPF